MSWDTIIRAIEIFLVFDITAIVLLIAVSMLLEARDRNKKLVRMQQSLWRSQQREAAEAMARRDRDET